MPLLHVASVRFALLVAVAPYVVPAHTSAQLRDPPAPPTTRIEWERAMPLDSLEALLLLEQLRQELPLEPESEFHRLLATLASRLSGNPPGLESPWGRPESRCAPVACEILATGLEGGAPPLDAISFAIRWAMDPLTWSDSLLSRADSTSPMFPQAREIALAALAPPGTSPHALPGPNASWREWRDWQGTFASDREAHYKIDLALALTGRDIRSEMARRFRDATADSARLKFGYRAMRLNVADVTVDDALRDLASGSPALRRLGFYEVAELSSTAPAAESALAVELQGRVLDMLLDGVEPWPVHALYSDAGVRPYGWYLARRRSNERTIVIVTSDDLFPEVAAYWTGDPGVTLMSQTEIDVLDEPTSTIKVSRLVALGPFAWISATSEYNSRRAVRQSLFGNYDLRSYRLTLMRTTTGWQLLAASVVIAEG